MWLVWLNCTLVYHIRESSGLSPVSFVLQDEFPWAYTAALRSIRSIANVLLVSPRLLRSRMRSSRGRSILVLVRFCSMYPASTSTVIVEMGMSEVELTHRCRRRAHDGPLWSRCIAGANIRRRLVQSRIRRLSYSNGNHLGECC